MIAIYASFPVWQAMSRTPDYLEWDSKNFVFKWPKRLAYVADVLEKLQLQSICIGYVFGAWGREGHGTHCTVAALVSCCTVLLPKALTSTAQLWIRYQGVTMLRKAYLNELPRLTPAEALEHKNMFEEKCAEIVERTGR